MRLMILMSLSLIQQKIVLIILPNRSMKWRWIRRQPQKILMIILDLVKKRTMQMQKQQPELILNSQKNQRLWLILTNLQMLVIIRLLKKMKERKRQLLHRKLMRLQQKKKNKKRKQMLCLIRILEFISRII